MRGVGLSTYEERRAAAALRRDVLCCYVHTSRSNQALHHRVLPHATVDVVWSSGRDLRVVGPGTAPRTILLEPGAAMFGVRCRPGHAGVVLGVPVADLADGRFALADVWGRPGARLAEQVEEAPHARAAFALVARALVERGVGRPGPDAVVLAALAALRRAPRTDVAGLSQSLALSERQLRRRFVANVGFGPRTFHGIARMRRFLALAPQRAVDELSLERLALEAGYADQSHLTRESTRLLGMPPRAHLRDPRTWG